MRLIASGVFVAMGILATPSAAVAADCVQTPPASPHVFTGTVVSVESSGRVATVRTDDGAEVKVIGTPSETAVSTVDRAYDVGARYEFHPLNATSPFNDNAFVRLRSDRRNKFHLQEGTASLPRHVPPTPNSRVEGGSALRRITTALAMAATIVLIPVLAAPQALAHQWDGWHWNRYGATVTINVLNTATYAAEANAALNDWDSNTILSLPRVGSHTDISMFDGNYGNTGWGGLAEIISYMSGNHITHGHARLNYYYSYTSAMKQGIQCQEVGHLFGLDHSNNGCMGLGYYNNVTTTVAHNWSDISSMYRTSHHASLLEGTEAVAGPPQYSAVWRYQPRSVAQAVRMGTSVVRATVLETKQAEDLVVNAQAEPGGQDRVPTQAITLRTDETFKGAPGAVFTLFRTGTDASGIVDDPAYQVGQQYVMILDGRRADGRQVALSPRC
ncbi:hypothetical protein [Nonomuraea guangzhouensis]|uniref:Uncharacterized protein n=1 Tax=Nonomuraea guangzhouensis TaxID=1291555 RepID=A0ABW4GJ52_9ACTN|nr:hypothetical protein [Nonomuraea guangzhouensis]